MRARTKRPKLSIGSTHTLLRAPITVFTVVELRRVPNKRGTTSTIPVWRGACKACGTEFEHPCVKVPKTRQCERCRGAIARYTEIPLDAADTEHEDVGLTVDQVNRAARAVRDIPRPAVSVQPTSLFTDR